MSAVVLRFECPSALLSLRTCFRRCWRSVSTANDGRAQTRRDDSVFVGATVSVDSMSLWLNPDLGGVEVQLK